MKHDQISFQQLPTKPHNQIPHRRSLVFLTCGACSQSSPFWAKSWLWASSVQEVINLKDMSMQCQMKTDMSMPRGAAAIHFALRHFLNSKQSMGAMSMISQTYLKYFLDIFKYLSNNCHIFQITLKYLSKILSNNFQYPSNNFRITLKYIHSQISLPSNSCQK